VGTQEILSILQLVFSALVLPLIGVLWSLKSEIQKLRLELAKDYMLKIDFEIFRSEIRKRLHDIEDWKSGQMAIQQLTNLKRNG
jgi:hypothetical protein